MKTFLSLVFSVLLCGPVTGQDKPYEDVWNFNKRIFDLEKRVEDLEKRMWAFPPPPTTPGTAVVPSVQRKVTTVDGGSRVTVPGVTKPPQLSYRQPVGHTHSCPKCGNVWDHQTNPGHTCTYCRTTVLTQDPSPRPIPVWTQPVQTYTVPAVTYTQTYTQPVVTYQIQPFGSFGSGGCAGGNCAVPTGRPTFQSFGGIFRR